MKHRYAATVIVAIGAICFAFLPAWAASLALDPTFSHDGIKRWSLNHGSVDALARDHDQIVAAGKYMANDVSMLYVSRINDDGSFDASFGDNGTVTVPANGLTNGGADVAILDDSSIVAAYTRAKFIVVNKWTAQGDSDVTFSDDGKQKVAAQLSRLRVPPHIAVDSDGRISVGTMIGGGDKVDALIARLLPNGSYDDSLSTNGRVTIDIKSWDWVDTLATDEKNRILLGTDHWKPVKHPLTYGEVIRLRQNGSFDSSFGDGGSRRIRLQDEGVNYPIAINVAAGGDIDVAAIASGASYGALRLSEDGGPVRSFGHDGRLSVNCECWMFDADIAGGHFAFAGTKGYSFRTRKYQSTALVARINRDGTKFELTHQDLFPDTRQERVYDVAILGSAMVIGGSVPNDPFLARFS